VSPRTRRPPRNSMPLPALEAAPSARHRHVGFWAGRAEQSDGQPLGFSASSVWGVSTRFRLQIPMIPRCERSFGTPQAARYLRSPPRSSAE
jgi:hypothetical protein